MEADAPEPTDGPDPGGHIEVHVTCADEAEADTIARALVEGRLAACVHVFPIRSTYRWRGEVEQADEIVVSATTRRALFPEVRATVTALHSYELPAVHAVAIAEAGPEHLAWIDAETG